MPFTARSIRQGESLLAIFFFSSAYLLRLLEHSNRISFASCRWSVSCQIWHFVTLTMLNMALRQHCHWRCSKVRKCHIWHGMLQWQLPNGMPYRAQVTKALLRLAEHVMHKKKKKEKSNAFSRALASRMFQALKDLHCHFLKRVQAQSHQDSKKMPRRFQKATK